MLEEDAEKEQLPLFHCLSSIKEGKFTFVTVYYNYYALKKTPKP